MSYNSFDRTPHSLAMVTGSAATIHAAVDIVLRPTGDRNPTPHTAAVEGTASALEAWRHDVSCRT